MKIGRVLFEKSQQTSRTNERTNQPTNQPAINQTRRIAIPSSGGNDVANDDSNDAICV